MGSLTKAFKTDKQKEQEGTWVDIIENDDGTMARMRILRMSQFNKKFSARYATLGKKNRVIRGNKQDLEIKALREAFVETCLVEWEYIENINEVPSGTIKETYMPFTRENAIKLFEALPDLFDMIVGEATRLENFQSEALEADAKNSFPSSNTN